MDRQIDRQTDIYTYIYSEDRYTENERYIDTYVD